MNLAIDAGGTKLRAEIWNKERFVTKAEAKSRDVGLYAWIETLLTHYRDIQTVGISYAGQVHDGIIVSSPNILIDEHEIKRQIESKYSVLLQIENDLNCAVLAEAKEFASKNICALSIGTGLGVGVVEGGRLVRGFKNVAAELGHIPHQRAPFRCGCGRDNCLELYASGSGLAKWIEYKKLSCSTSLQDLNEAQEYEIVEMFYDALLKAVGTTLTLFNPQVLVLGGGIIEANPHLQDFVLKNIKEYTLANSLEGVNICTSRLKNASLLGALLLKDFND